MKNLNKIFIIISIALTLVLYQNCGSSFNSNSQTNLSSSSVDQDQESVPFQGPEDATSTMDELAPLPEPGSFRFLKEAETVDESATDCKFTWQLSMPAKAYISYGTNKDSLNLKNSGADSFTYSTHIQSIKDLDSEEKYYFKIVAQNEQNEVIESSVKSCETKAAATPTVVETPVKPIDGESHRDKHWKDQGYMLVYHNTPKASDYGSTAESYFTGAWSNGQPIRSKWIKEEGLQFTAAPDGTPALKSTLNKGDVQTLNIRGQQLTQSNTTTSTVFSYEIWIESIGPTQGYIGGGHYWGSTPGVYRTPGGAQYYDDAFSFRSIRVRSNGAIAPYSYVSKPSGDGAFGDTPGANVGNIVPANGRWVLIETEIDLNKPASASNGFVKSYVDHKVSGATVNAQLRNDSNAFMKGFSIFIRDNNGAAVRAVQYYKNWKVYTRP